MSEQCPMCGRYNGPWPHYVSSAVTVYCCKDCEKNLADHLEQIAKALKIKDTHEN